MNRLLVLLMIIVSSLACRTYNKGVIAKKELRSKKPPSVKIAEGYDKKSGKNKIITNPKKAGKARDKQQEKIKKRGDKYLKKKRRKQR